ncbi:hypothetical protein DEFDS_0698 [Deferribacter desulfuricans SSM1]|uniref:CheW-like domain-containing protein n=2 Tax=Deferribacter TaxID=53572 RepID=D3PC55_DEFDS|nr:hypothetical protein DEFDS_0698 [Deferribacter desulfuricans SSM1]
MFLFYIKNISFAIGLKSIVFTKNLVKISKYPGLRPPLLTFYFYDEKVIPIYNLGYFFNENSLEFKDLIFIGNEEKTIALVADDMDVADNYEYVKCDDVSNLSFIEKNKLLVFNGRKHLIIDENKLLNAKELHIKG